MERPSIPDIIEAIRRQLEQVDQPGSAPKQASGKRKKLPGATPHSGIYRMSLTARNRVSEIQKKRWAESAQAMETEIGNRIKALYNRQ